MNLCKLMSMMPLFGMKSLGILRIAFLSFIICVSGNLCGHTGKF